MNNLARSSFIFCAIDKIWQWCFILRWMMSQCDTPPPPPTSYKWFSKWFQLLGQSGGAEVHSTIADTIAILQIHSEKFNICSCQGDSWWARAAPTKSAGWYFPISDISCERSAAGTRHLAHTFYFHTITVWLSHFECLYVPTVFVAQIFSDQSEIFFVVTLKYFFRGNHSESGAIIRDCLETRARPPIEFFHCANTE